MHVKISRRSKGFGGMLVVLCTIILSWVGLGIFAPELTRLENLPHRIYRVVKIAMGGDPTVEADPAADVPWQLQLVKIFVVGILLFTVFKIVQKVFRDQYAIFRAMFMRGHTIVCGVGDKGLQTLKDLERSWGKKGVGVELDPGSGSALLAEKEDHPIIWGDAREEETLKEAGVKRAANLICFLPGDQSGFEVLSAVHNIYKKQRSNSLHCYLPLTNLRLAEIIERSGHLAVFRDAGLEIRFFNLNKMIARHLFQQLAIDLFEDISSLKGKGNIRLILFGFGDAGKSLLLQALRVMHFDPARKTEIVIADQHGGVRKRKFEEEYPFAGKALPITFEEFDGTCKAVIRKYASGDENVLPVVITTFDNQDENLALALEILEQTPGEKFKVYAKNSSSKNLASLLKRTDGKRTRLSFFGDLETFCRMEYITGKEQDLLAEMIHNDYLKQQPEMVASESERYKTTWKDLLEDARDASRAQADHLVFKMALAGIRPGSEITEWAITDDMVETLAMTDHERWCAHRYINGWQYGDVRDDFKKLHPSLVSWDQLPEAEKQKDRNAILRVPQLIAQTMIMANAG